MLAFWLGLLALAVAGLVLVMNVSGEDLEKLFSTLNFLSPKPSFNNLVTFEGKYLTFQYPPYWSPQSISLTEGSYELVFLGIPEAMDQTVGFFPVEFSSMNPRDTISEQEIIIGGRKGKKWIRLVQNAISYDYFTTGHNQQGSFGLHVTLASEDEEVEQLLDAVVGTIQFRE